MNDYSNVYRQQAVNEQMWILQVEWATESHLITGLFYFWYSLLKSFWWWKLWKRYWVCIVLARELTTFQCFANLDWRTQNTRNTRIQDPKFFLMLFCYLWIVFVPCVCLLLSIFVTSIFLCQCVILKDLNPLCANPTKWPITHKQFVGKLWRFYEIGP